MGNRDTAIRARAFATAALLTLGGAFARAEFLAVYGGPTYDAPTGSGFTEPWVPRQQQGVNDLGTSVLHATKYSGNTHLGRRALRWDASGAPAVELGHLGTSAAGVTHVEAAAVSAGGTVVGFANKFAGTNFLGPRAARWEPGVTSATELGHLGTDIVGFTSAGAFAVNAGGTAVGYASVHTTDGGLGTRAVRWVAGATAATELGHIGTASNGFTSASALAVNDAGTAVGEASKYSGSTFLGKRAVRWGADGVSATELDHLGINPAGTNASALAVNRSGTTVGYAQKYHGATWLGERAVRWDASGTAATELGHLGPNTSGFALARALAVAPDGTAVGYAHKYNGFNDLRMRAVRWNANETVATELPHFGTTAAGLTEGGAFAINASGIAVGFANRYTAGGTFIGIRAMLWRADGTAVDLNDFIDPLGGWELTRADSISDTNFVAGVGYFDPDGAGPAAGYSRSYLLDATAAIPEPAPLALTPIACLSLFLSRMRPRWRGRR